MSKILTVNNISKTYPGENLGAVSEVSFDLEAGEILGIIGESGSGKTTLLRMLAGLMKPDSGEITFDGKPLNNPDEQLIAGHPGIKIVFQDYDLMPNMTVSENVAYMLLGYEEDYKSHKVERLLKLCGLEERKDSLPRELSGGQQQRLSLARGLADDPDLLLMDEPFSNIDPVSKKRLLMEIQSISRTLGVGLVFVTHDTQDAMLLAERIGFVKDGKLIQLDEPQRLYNHPKNIHVARFLGIVNEFSIKEWFVICDDSVANASEVVLLRAEDVRYEYTDDSNASVTDCIFLGKDFLVKVIFNGDKEIMLYSKEFLENGLKIKVWCSQGKAMYF